MTINRVMVILLTVASLGSLAAAGLMLAEQSTYTVQDSGTSIPVSGSYQTVEELLEAAEIVVREEDVVVPETIEILDPAVPVEIRRAQPVTLHTASGIRTLWTTESTVGGFLREARITVQPRDQIFADGMRVPPGTVEKAPLPEMLEIGRFVTVTVMDGGQRKVLRTAAETIGDALQDADVELGSSDGVVPPLEEPVIDEMTITVRRAAPLTVQVDGQFIPVETYLTNSVKVLTDAGITLAAEDRVIPGADVVLKPHDVVQVVRVTSDFRLEDEPIPYQTLWQATQDLPIDNQALISSGVPGIRRRRYRVAYEDGVKTSDTLDSDWVAREPVNEVMGYGTRIDLGTVETPEGPREYWRVVRMRATSYTAASSGKTPDDPEYGRTASGMPAGYGVVAVDRSIVPFRSYVYVPGYGIGFVGDTGGGIRGRWIDLGYDEDNYVSWSGYVDVYYLTPVPAPEDINYLLPSIVP